MNASPDVRQRGVVFYALLFVCLNVWGYVFYQIAEGLGSPEDTFDTLLLPPTTTSIPPTQHRAGPDAPYQDTSRDPFERPAGLFAQNIVPQTRMPRPIPPEPPPFALNGIVDGTALLHGEDGSVFVARAGERAGSVQVLSVKRDQVTVRFQGRSHTLRLFQ